MAFVDAGSRVDGSDRFGDHCRMLVACEGCWGAYDAVIYVAFVVEDCAASRSSSD